MSGVGSSEGSTGAGGPASGMVPWRCRQVGAGCWQEASGSSYVVLPKGFLECPHVAAAGFLRWGVPESMAEAVVFFATWSLKSPSVTATFYLSEVSF